MYRVKALGRSASRDPRCAPRACGACGVGGRPRRPRPFDPPGPWMILRALSLDNQVIRERHAPLAACRLPRRSRPTIPGMRPPAVPGIWFRRQHQAHFRLRLPLVDGHETGLCAGRSRRAGRRAVLVLSLRKRALASRPGDAREGASERAEETDELCSVEM